MNMQHNGFLGSPIGLGTGERFADRMKRINEARLDEGALVTLNCRISAGNVPWFALRVRTGREKAVETRLDAVGIRCLVPLRKGPDLRRRGRLVEGAMMPVIHGYVLVQMLPIVDYLAGLQGVEDAIDVLGGCEKPIRLSNREVSRFNMLAKGGAYDWERPVDLSLVQGERVLIAAGPFSGQHAVVATANRKGRGDVVVVIRLMGGELPVSVPLALLRKL